MATTTPMLLDIDLGNTRLKWRLLSSNAAVACGHWGHDLAGLSEELAEFGLITEVRVVNVAGIEMKDELHRWSMRFFATVPEFAEVQAVCGKVACGYSHPEDLGVDRWLAVLAAWQHLGETCVVVDAGTALTIDVVLADNKSSSDQIQATHHGGYIVPGLSMMSDALYARTEGVRPKPAELADLQPGRDTGAAVQRGSVAMVVAMIERVRAQTVLRLGSIGKTGVATPVPVVLTGGDTDCLATFIAEPLYCIPDLVLDGLAIALPVSED